ncbi:keratinocyte differentiation factor 1 isoform X2 [Hemicordylus capensis]|uniref:keratinocyte differentiation factor 1 isoform X2 n=1 Tax=Hemicordylus capensis TaxID=884348 RepID=UPI002302789A|nr:keratinocyte differentiation factor 1 isoform X2 [Hemicordylus capensis]
MLGRRPGHPVNLSNNYLPPQDVIPPGINSPKASDVSLEVFSGSTPELKPTRKTKRDRKAFKAKPRDFNGKGEETNTFIPGATDTPQPLCCPTLSQAWSAYKAIFCCIVTCGDCCRDCQASIPYPYNEPLTDDGRNRDSNGRLPNTPASGSPTEKNGSQPKKNTVGSSFSYPDLKLKGVPVFQNQNPSSHMDTDSCYKEPFPDKTSRNSIEKQPFPSSHRSSEEHYSFHESDLEFGELSGSMSSREIDVLIFKKLTELFSVHQIDELAKCTSDTVFLEKTNKISDLINSITQDYNLDEQDAECRLVRGIIRISTRKSRVRPRVPLPALPSPEENMNHGNLPDSGNETMVPSMVTREEVTTPLKYGVKPAKQSVGRINARGRNALATLALSQRIKACMTLAPSQHVGLCIWKVLSKDRQRAGQVYLPSQRKEKEEMKKG